MVSKKEINVYDFDGTIYNGDSSIDFFLFALSKQKRIFLLLPKICIYFIFFLLHIVSREKFKTVFFSFLQYFDNTDKLIDDFWVKHRSKINPALELILEKDKSATIVSASPAFLIEPIGKILGVKKVLASNVDIKTGKWLDNNCRGSNKLEYLEKEYHNYKINNSYSDSYSDRFIARESKNAYMVQKQKIISYNESSLYKKKVNHSSNMIALCFFILYFVFGMLINFNYDLSSNYNLFFQSDTSRVYFDFISIGHNHSRVSVHPLILLIVQPFALLLQGITHDSMIAIVLFQSIIGCLCVKYLYKSIIITSKNKIGSCLLSVIYGLSFSSVIFSTTIEIYCLSALSLILLWYNIILDLKINTKSSIWKYVGIGLFTTGVLLTNYSVFLVGSLLLLLARKLNLKKVLCLNIVTVLGILSLSFVQEYVWVKAPNILKTFTSSVDHETTKYASFDINSTKIKNVGDDIYFNGLIAKRVKHHFINNKTKFDNVNTVIIFKDYYSYKDVILLFFYGTLFFYLIKNFKNNKLLNIGLLLSLGGMSLLHIFYGNEDCFLYSQNIIYLIILLFGINYQKNNKIMNLFLIFISIIELISNIIVFKDILLILHKFFKPSILLNKFGLYKEAIIFTVLIIFTILLLYLGYLFLIKYIDKYKGKYLIGLLCCLTFISCLFIKFNTYLNNSSSVVTNSKKVVSEKLEDVFESKYHDEVKSYNKYLTQYKTFVNSDNIVITNNFNKEKFYFFGLGDRAKYVYANGVIRDIKTEAVYRRFDIESELIIPNLYTVLLKTRDGKFYKIIEDETSVRIIDEDDSIILPNTDIKITLSSFEDYKYSEILKVLYQEILFNIEDGVIYPNIIVYDEVWYRDAAYGAMVLEKTGNIDLIKKWILSIDDIYDKANGYEENDNLGELLYLLSLVTDKDNKTVNKILQRLDKIVIKDDKGKYICNKTDGTNKPAYQTEWLKYGLEKLGVSNNYHYDANDNYSNLLWFRKLEYNNLTEKNYNRNFPYLGYAQRHLFNNSKTTIYVSNQLYPLTWENKASKANYNKMTILGDYFVEEKVSPTHVWAAAELFMLLEAEK